jgi:hypothetical protein
VQNLHFIALLACRLITLDSTKDPSKLIANSAVRKSKLYPVIKQMFKQHGLLAEDEYKVHGFVCSLKRQVQALLAVDPREAYHATAQLQFYPSLDYEYYLLNRLRGSVSDSKEHPC